MVLWAVVAVALAVLAYYLKDIGWRGQADAIELAEQHAEAAARQPGPARPGLRHSRRRQNAGGTGAAPSHRAVPGGRDRGRRRRRHRALVRMATGAGKTFPACTLTHRLLTHGGVRRVLFLVDHANLDRQAVEEFVNDKPPGSGPLFTEEYAVSTARNLIWITGRNLGIEPFTEGCEAMPLKQNPAWPVARPCGNPSSGLKTTLPWLSYRFPYGNYVTVMACCQLRIGLEKVAP